MAVSTQVVSFVKSTGANGTTQDVALNFTPKAIIVYSCNSTTTALANEYSWSQGFSDGTNHACFCIHSDDASAAADTGRIHSNADVYIKVDEATPTTTVRCRGSVAFQTNNLRFTWTVNDAVGTRITVIAYGGADITGVKVNTVNINETVNGATEDYTGLGFTPNGDDNTALFLFGINHTANSSSAPTTTAEAMFGVATRAYNPHPGTPIRQVLIGNNAENAADPSDTWRHMSNDRCFAITNTAGAYDNYGFLNAWITDGFRMTWDDAAASLTVKFSYMVINGGQWDCGTLTAPTSALANQDKAVSLGGKTPKSLILLSTSATTSAALDTYAIYSIGATDGTTHSCHGAIEEDAQATMDGYRFHSTDGIVYRGLSLDGAVNDAATFDSFSTDNFRLDYSPKSVNAQLIHYVVVADQFTSILYDRPISETSVSISEALARVPVRVKAINETAVSVSEALARIQSLIKTINETSISVSETLARIQLKIKPISEPAISVSEALVRGLAFTKPISEPSISTNDTIVRLPLYLRPISNESSITTNDSIARWISVSYTLAEPSILVNDTIAGALFYLRTVNESAISVNDVIVRLLAAVRSISDPSISTNDTIAKIANYLRLISDPSISNINDTSVRIPIYLKSISETAITTNDSIVRLLAATRAISESSITVNDTIARIQSLIKQISESAISVNDSVQGSLLFTALLIESRIKWYYSLLTRKIQV